ncbi:Glyoxalase/Bleomycin resistance protein/Dihydroxybiphenyl dioxygenase [Leptodontidium sp. MPI-SDFR-AT-0119]|nr:Glyoxalase/Bleomycin resistance protein/Dihydroxybiphenyl dioxygenase [Leptodontidium sp. MPI-SDFR-AT-0119]
MSQEHKPWLKPNPNRVILKRPVWVHYGHVDIEKAHQFALDFGLEEAYRTSNPERIYYKGYNDQPVVYVSERTDKPLFFGGAMEAATEGDLNRAAALPGAGPIRNSDFPGGGKVVKIRDPDGVLFNIVFGYQTIPTRPPPKSASIFNPAQEFDDEKPRRGVYQRLTKGAAAVFKLGHFGHISHDVGKISSWYMENFNIRSMDIQADMKDESQDFAVFYNLDLGKHYSDHHCFFHFQKFPDQEFAGPHHSSFEVHDTDVQLQGHYHLRNKGYKLMWGVGRHLLGSQIFDYWYDTEGFIVEHYTDGDVVNEDNEPGRHALSRDDYTIWGGEFNDLTGAYFGNTSPSAVAI